MEPAGLRGRALANGQTADEFHRLSYLSQLEFVGPRSERVDRPAGRRGREGQRPLRLSGGPGHVTGLLWQREPQSLPHQPLRRRRRPVVRGGRIHPRLHEGVAGMAQVAGRLRGDVQPLRRDAAEGVRARTELGGKGLHRHRDPAGHSQGTPGTPEGKRHGPRRPQGATSGSTRGRSCG